MIKLSINSENKHSCQIPSLDDINNSILKVLKEKGIEDGNFEIDIKFVEKQEIHELNKKYREIDKPTDVLSFPIQNDISTINIGAPILLGDIIICPEMAEDNIIELIKHSTLHLLGYHHPGDE